MKASLKQKLNNLIQEKCEVSYGELATFVVEEGYRLSTAERRLRASESPEVEPVIARSRRNTTYIKAYKWRGTPAPKKPKIVLEGDKAIMIYE